MTRMKLTPLKSKSIPLHKGPRHLNTRPEGSVDSRRPSASRWLRFRNAGGGVPYESMYRFRAACDQIRLLHRANLWRMFPFCTIPVGNAALSVPPHRWSVRRMHIKKMKLKILLKPIFPFAHGYLHANAWPGEIRLTGGTFFFSPFPTRIVQSPSLYLKGPLV